MKIPEFSGPEIKKIKILGNEIDVREPSIDESEWLEEQSSDPNAKHVKILREFLGKLGVPNEYLGKLSKSEFLKLVSEISDSKKN